MLKKSKDCDENYLATVVTLDNMKEHPNADRLVIIELFGVNVITAKGSYELNQKMIYFPIETRINAEFLSWANLFDNPEMNADRLSKGFFSYKQQRTRPVRLRGIPSEGFLYPVSKIANFFGVSEDVFKVGTSFDMVGDKVLLEKFVPEVKDDSQKGRNKGTPKWMSILPLPIRKVVGRLFYNKKRYSIANRIVDGQFHFHYSTNNLSKSIFAVKPEDHITITSKIHGTSALFSRILCFKKRNLLDILLFKKIHNKPKEYTNIYASRSIVKNREDDQYTKDLWGQYAKLLFENNAIQDGITLYGEIYGYVGHSKMVQKGYDYGCEPGSNKLSIYRITHTDSEGNVREFSFKEILDYCELNHLSVVPVYYQGVASDIFPDIPVDENWSITFLTKLADTYLEKDCEFCRNEVPSEGIVLRVESDPNKTALKYKSFRFKERESGERDLGETNIEEIS
jgi:hypothetical protein